MKTFSFLTKQSNRVDVKASTPKSAYNKLMSIPFFSERITKSFIVYNKNGLASVYSWQSLREE